MRKFFNLVLVAMLTVLLLTACSPAGAAQGFVELPTDVRGGITAVILVGVSFVFVKLITLVPLLKFLEPFREPLAMAIAAELIHLIEVATPDAYGAVVIIALQLVLAVLALFKFFEILRARGVRFFK